MNPDDLLTYPSKYKQDSNYTTKNIPTNEERLEATIQKIKEHPYVWWVENNASLHKVQVSIGVTYEFVDGMQGEDGVRALAQHIASEIMAERNR